MDAVCSDVNCIVMTLKGTRWHLLHCILESEEFISVNCFSWAQIKNTLHFSKFNLQVNEPIVLEPESNLLFSFINFFIAVVKI